LSARHLAGIERAIKSCPAYGTLLIPPSVEMTVEGQAAADAATPAGAAASVG